jgi:hypothetical protein
MVDKDGKKLLVFPSNLGWVSVEENSKEHKRLKLCKEVQERLNAPLIHDLAERIVTLSKDLK